MTQTSQNPSPVIVGAVQANFHDEKEVNVQKAIRLVEELSKKGAQIILLPELFEGPYFCKTQKEEWFSWATPAEGHPTLELMKKVAQKNKVVLPISFFERDKNHYYNSLCMIDADGTELGIYRKSHIPDGPGYQEKFYFRPGNTGFKVWNTRYARVGVGICWDQWFPECARSMVLQGAELLFYPTAIGNEPEAPELDTQRLWQRAMIGHSVSNVIPVIAANRIGNEEGQTFYGSSFISDHRGDFLQEMDRKTEGVILSKIDLNQVRRDRASFGFFRDRRPEFYQGLCEA